MRKQSFKKQYYTKLNLSTNKNNIVNNNILKYLYYSLYIRVLKFRMRRYHYNVMKLSIVFFHHIVGKMGCNKYSLYIFHSEIF